MRYLQQWRALRAARANACLTWNAFGKRSWWTVDEITIFYEADRRTVFNEINVYAQPQRLPSGKMSKHATMVPRCAVLRHFGYPQHHRMSLRNIQKMCDPPVPARFIRATYPNRSPVGRVWARPCSIAQAYAYSKDGHGLRLHHQYTTQSVTMRRLIGTRDVANNQSLVAPVRRALGKLRDDQLTFADGTLAHERFVYTQALREIR